MYSEVQHIFYSSMSNPELFQIQTKDDKEDQLSNFEVLKFQTEKHDGLSSGSESHSQDQKEDNTDQEKEDKEQLLQSRIVLSKHSDSEANSPSSREQHKVEGDQEDDGFRTPTSLDHKIPVAKQCPPAPRKPKPSLKRKASQSSSSCRHPLDLSKEVELLFSTQYNPFSDSHQSTKRVRIEEHK